MSASAIENKFDWPPQSLGGPRHSIFPIRWRCRFSRDWQSYPQFRGEEVLVLGWREQTQRTGAAFHGAHPPSAPRTPRSATVWKCSFHVGQAGSLMPHTFRQSCESCRNCGADALVPLFANEISITHTAASRRGCRLRAGGSAPQSMQSVRYWEKYAALGWQPAAGWEPARWPGKQTA